MAKLVVTNIIKQRCCNEIGLCARNVDTILGSIGNAMGRVYLIVLRERLCPC